MPRIAPTAAAAADHLSAAAANRPAADRRQGATGGGERMKAFDAYLRLADATAAELPSLELSQQRGAQRPLVRGRSMLAGWSETPSTRNRDTGSIPPRRQVEHAAADELRRYSVFRRSAGSGQCSSAARSSVVGEWRAARIGGGTVAVGAIARQVVAGRGHRAADRLAD